MWGDPRSSNRMDPFSRSQDERFASGWNRDFLARSDGLALERNAGVFQSGRDPYRPLEFAGMLGPSGRQFAGREAAPFSFATRGLPIDFRAGDRMAHDLAIRDLQARELASLDFRVRDAMTSEFRSREMHPIDYRIREELMMEYRERDKAALDFRNRMLPPLDFKDRGVPHLDYRERELLDFRSREAPPEFRGRDMLDIDFRNKEQSHTELRESNVSDIDFRNRNQLLSDFRGKEVPHSDFLGTSSSPVDFRGKEGSQLDFRARDLPHSDFNAPGSSDLDMRDRDTAMFNFQSVERSEADQDFRERNVAETPMDIPDRLRLPPNQQLVDYIQSQPTVLTPEREVHEDRLNKTEDPALGSSLYSEEQQINSQPQDEQSCELPPDTKNSDGNHNIDTAEDVAAESPRQPLTAGEQLRTPPGRGVKRGADLDFLGRQDTDYRNMDYRDVDLRFDYSHGKAHAQERSVKEPRPDLQMGKSGRSVAKLSKIGESSASHATLAKEEQAARASDENFDEFVQRVSTAVNAALDPKITKVADVDQDYRHASSGEECASRFIQIHGLPADTDKKEVIEAIRSSDEKPIEDLQLSDYNPGGVISVRSPPKEVWICGHSLVQCAKERARRLPQGTQLGISCHKAKITWMGEAGMKWDQLIPTMREMVGKSPAPDLIVVHLGENDLMQMTGVDLIIRIKRDLRYLMTLFPRAHIMWSSLLPRRVWLGAKKPAAIDRTRKEINREVKLFCRQVGMLQLQHDSIRFESPHQFSSDGDQLSEIGLEVFTVDLQASIQGWLNVR